MKYIDGQQVKLGDVVALGKAEDGVVVCCIGDGVFSERFPAKAWSYLQHGCLLEFANGALLHLDDVEAEEDLRLISRGQKLPHLHSS